ncbi:hypothetical protein Taro_018365 [Colocasia esculenta]|uniref:Uncharacterized protein n=1 Tax=Colocasia esculenta TaxID=4460 RepID=A0A843UQK0_COLES|nr:hypothetical protein [Colocasia esculenta]
MVLWGKSNFGRSRRSRGMHTRHSEATVEGKRRARARRSWDRAERAGEAEILGAITGLVRIVDNPRRDMSNASTTELAPPDSYIRRRISSVVRYVA